MKRKRDRDRESKRVGHSARKIRNTETKRERESANIQDTHEEVSIKSLKMLRAIV